MVCEIINRVSDIAKNIIYVPKKRIMIVVVHRNDVGEVARRLNEYEIEIKYPRRGVIATVKVRVR